jgi:hypothetical protein
MLPMLNWAYSNQRSTAANFRNDLVLFLSSLLFLLVEAAEVMVAMEVQVGEVIVTIVQCIYQSAC